MTTSGKVQKIVIEGQRPLHYDVEDGGCARIAELEGDVFLQDGSNRRLVHRNESGAGLFVRIQSWDGKRGRQGGHELTHALEGKLVRVTIEVLPEVTR